jgi:hypothetical protein
MITLECPACNSEETNISIPSTQCNRIYKCQTCGESLVPKRQASAPANPNTLLQNAPWRMAFQQGNGSGDASDAIFPGMEQNLSQLLSHINPDLAMDFMDPSFRELFERLVGEEAPQRTVNQKYLDLVGVLTVDPKKLVLADVCLVIGGSIHSLLIPAEFSSFPAAADLEAPIILGDSVYGDSMNQPLSHYDHKIVLLDRGKVTFAQKYLSYTSSSSTTPPEVKAIIVSQTNNYKFPFMMTDSTKELQTNPDFCGNNCQTRFPVLMISENDGNVIKKLIEKLSLKSSSSSSPSSSELVVRLKIGNPEKECSICCENYEVGDEIYKLPCRHLYHKHCLARWVQSHPNCPLCRQPLNKPKNKNEDAKPSSAESAPFNNFYT